MSKEHTAGGSTVNTKPETVIRANDMISTKTNETPYPSIEVFVEGMGTCCTPGDSPIYLELYEGKWWLRVWSDINSEDPTHSIDMSGALESCRKEEGGSMSRIECPSEAWDRRCEQEERAAFPSDREMVESLDAMERSEYAICESIEGDEDYESDTVIWSDFSVFESRDGHIRIAYVVVYDGPGECASTDGGVFDASELGDLNKSTWFPAESQVDAVNEALAMDGSKAFIHWKDVEKAQKAWTKELVSQVRQAEEES
jgi:hypothetical protein